MTTQTISDRLIYEISKGQPIYYKNYKQVLSKEYTIDDIMGCSALQGLIIAAVLRFLYNNTDEKQYAVFTNEWGLKGQNLLRAADIAIYERKDLVGYTFTNKYITLPPKIVIEVDIKADTENFDTPIDYYHQKTQDLLDFGVETVIWITTQSQKIMIATNDNAWTTYNWTHEIALLPNCTFSLQDLLDKEVF